jgi:hypothetical protein
VVAPYKSPLCELPENAAFNNHVSMVRIRSEHCIGFLKGRFPSLKNLRVSITDAKSHQFAGYWIAGCVCLHNFAMESEAEERGVAADEYGDPFITAGLEISSEQEPDAPTRRGAHSGKQKREQLKGALQEAKRQQELLRSQRRQHEEGLD